MGFDDSPCPLEMSTWLHLLSVALTANHYIRSRHRNLSSPKRLLLLIHMNQEFCGSLVYQPEQLFPANRSFEILERSPLKTYDILIFDAVPLLQQNLNHPNCFRLSVIHHIY